MAWDREWMVRTKPRIEFLELYAVTVGILLWINKFQNKRLLLHCDNDSVCKMINKSSSGCKNCMVLLRIIVLECLRQNVKVTAEWVATGDNGKADALSRLEFDRFWDLVEESGNEMYNFPTDLPADIWPITKIWIK